MSAGLLRSNWRQIRAKLTETIDCFEEEDLDYSHAAGHWTVRERILHIAHEEMIEVVYGTMRAVSEFPEAYNAADYQTMEAVKKVLADVHDQTVGYLQT